MEYVALEEGSLYLEIVGGGVLYDYVIEDSIDKAQAAIEVRNNRYDRQLTLGVIVPLDEYKQLKEDANAYHDLRQ